MKPALILKSIVVAPVALGVIIWFGGLVSFPNWSAVGLCMFFVFWGAMVWPIFLLREREFIAPSKFLLKPRALFLFSLIGTIGVISFSLSVLKGFDLRTVLAMIKAGGTGEARNLTMFSESGGLLYYVGILLIPFGIFSVVFGVPGVKTYDRLTLLSLAIFIILFSCFGVVRLGRTTFVFSALILATSCLLYGGNIFLRSIRIPLMTFVFSMLFLVLGFGVFRQSSSISTGYDSFEEFGKMTGMKLGPLGAKFPGVVQETVMHLGHYTSAPIVGVSVLLGNNFRSEHRGLPGYTHFSVFLRRIYPIVGIEENVVDRRSGSGMFGVVELSELEVWSAAVWLTVIYAQILDFGFFGALIFSLGSGMCAYVAFRYRGKYIFCHYFTVIYCCYCIYFIAQPFVRENYYQASFVMILVLSLGSMSGFFLRIVPRAPKGILSHYTRVIDRNPNRV